MVAILIQYRAYIGDTTTVCAGILLTVTDKTGITSVDDVRCRITSSRGTSMKIVADEEKTCRCLKINDQQKISRSPSGQCNFELAGRRQLTELIS